jgi:hypothetical protein
LSREAAVALPLAFSAAVAAFSFLPGVEREPGYYRAVLGAAAGLLVWAIALYVAARRSGRDLTLEVVLRRRSRCPHRRRCAIDSRWSGVGRSSSRS